MITVTLLWNGAKFAEIVDDEKSIKNEIMKKALDKCQSDGISGYYFEKFCSMTNDYKFTELKDIINDDVINIITKRSGSCPNEVLSRLDANQPESVNPVKAVVTGTPKSASHLKQPSLVRESEENKELQNQHLSAMKRISEDDDAGFREKLLIKVNGKDFLTDTERDYIFHFIKFHNDCLDVSASSADSGPSTLSDEASASNGKKALNKNEDSQDQLRRKKKKMDIGLQHDVSYVNDYEEVKEFLRVQCKLPPEERDKKYKLRFTMLFDERRAFMMRSAPTAHAFKELHPYMFNYNQVVTEFELITKNENIYSKFECNVRSFCTSVLELTPPSPNHNMVMRRIDNARDEIDKRWVKMTGSLFVLSTFMSEERKGILLCSDEAALQENSYPYIQCAVDSDHCLEESGPFTILIEGIELCKPPHLVKAFFALIAAYYIFNIVYSPICSNTLTLLENLYMQHTDRTGKLPTWIEEQMKCLKKQCHKNALR